MPRLNIWRTDILSIFHVWLKYIIGVAPVGHKAICGGYGACSTEFDRNDPCSAHDDCEKTECKI